MYRFSQAMIGTWVAVMATSEGAVVGRGPYSGSATLDD
jgi:hypothetical protein